LLFNAKGFTLVETLISVTILSIILLSMMGFFYQSAKIEQSNSNQLVAINLAQSTLVRLSAGGYNEISGIGSHTLDPCDDIALINCTPIINGERYTTEIDIRNSESDVSLHVATVTVTKESETITLATLEGYLQP
jgi:prepilin-type N-terminal cleavage/methylation domain-containing protein